MRISVTAVPAAIIAAVLTYLLAAPLPASAQGQPNHGCGPLSRWTGQVCIGPRDKAYCPQDMTMQGDACASNATAPMSMVAKPPGPSNISRAGLQVFHSGNVTPQSQFLPKGYSGGSFILGAGLAPFNKNWNFIPIESGKFTLTPNHPVIPGSGSLGCGWCGSSPDESSTGYMGIGWGNMNLPYFNAAILTLDAVAGKSYVIDETVSAEFGWNAGNCQYTVTGPDGSKTISTCTGANQHLVFAYQATTSGPVFFDTQTTWKALLFGVTVEPVQ